MVPQLIGIYLAQRFDQLTKAYSQASFITPFSCVTIMHTLMGKECIRKNPADLIQVAVNFFKQVFENLCDCLKTQAGHSAMSFKIAQFSIIMPLTKFR